MQNKIDFEVYVGRLPPPLGYAVAIIAWDFSGDHPRTAEEFTFILDATNDVKDFRGMTSKYWDVPETLLPYDELLRQQVRAANAYISDHIFFNRENYKIPSEFYHSGVELKKDDKALLASLYFRNKARSELTSLREKSQCDELQGYIKTLSQTADKKKAKIDDEPIK